MFSIITLRILDSKKQLGNCKNVVLFLLVLMFQIQGSAQDCTCVEYLYLNEPTGGGAIHKFTVNLDGSLTEVAGANGIPWFDNNAQGEQMTEPHGLAMDVNGNLYIGERSSGDVRRFDCEGNIDPETGADGFVINTGGNSYATDGIYVYFHAQSPAFPKRIRRYSLCDGTEQGEVCLNQEDASKRAWGIKRYDDGTFIMTTDFLSEGTENMIFVFNPQESDWDGNTCFDPVLTEADGILGNASGDRWEPWGTTFDADGNLYIGYAQYVQGGSSVFPNAGAIQKWSPDGSGGYNLESTLTDFDADGSGFTRASELAYSETNGYLYVSTTSPVDDCVARFTTDPFAYDGVAVPSPGTGTNAKGMSLNTECCPPSGNNTFSAPLCQDEFELGMSIPLGDLTGCGGKICDGDWTLVDTPIDMSFDECINALTITGSQPCGTFSLSGGGAGSSCAAYTITYNICYSDCSIPTCEAPASPVLAVTNNICPSIEGSFSIVTPCNDTSTIEYSIDGGNNWSSTLPTWMDGRSVIARCVDNIDDTCVSSNSVAVVAVLDDCCPQPNCGTITIQQNE